MAMRTASFCDKSLPRLRFRVGLGSRGFGFRIGVFKEVWGRLKLGLGFKVWGFTVLVLSLRLSKGIGFSELAPAFLVVGREWRIEFWV